MESQVWWTSLEDPGLEQLRLVENATGVVADSLVLGTEGTTPFRLWYQIWADHNWNIRECRLQVGGEQGQRVHLYSDGQGHWTDAAGDACAVLEGCLDLDISRTPFTNTLPIRRLTLAPGESADLLVAYLSVPDLTIRPMQQRYTCLSRTDSGGVYRYESVQSTFTADLLVDAQGLVVDYPAIWKRVETRSREQHISSQAIPVLDGLLAAGPHPELADKLHLFGQFVGDWDVDWRGYQPDGGAQQTGKGEIHFAWVLNGRAIQDVWIFPTREDQQRGLPLDEWGTTLRWYDPQKNIWHIFFASPVSTVGRLMTARPVGDEIWIEGSNLQGHSLRWIFSQVTSGSFHWRNLVSDDEGQTWRLQEELLARRVS